MFRCELIPLWAFSLIAACGGRPFEVGTTTWALRSMFSGVRSPKRPIGISEGKLLIGREPEGREPIDWKQALPGIKPWQTFSVTC
jgi:hypothetical protein